MSKPAVVTNISVLTENQLSGCLISRHPSSRCGNFATRKGHTITSVTRLTSYTSVVQLLNAELVISNQWSSDPPTLTRLRCKKVKVKGVNLLTFGPELENFICANPPQTNLRCKKTKKKKYGRWMTKQVEMNLR